MEKDGFTYYIVGLEKEELLASTLQKVYAFICHNDDCTWSEIKTELNTEGGNLTTILKKLETAQFMQIYQFGKTLLF